MDKSYSSSIVVDIDGTLCPIKKSKEEYIDLQPDVSMVEALRGWKERGYRIVLFTARNMRTYEGNLGKINKYTAPVLLEWLSKHDIPYDEISFGKPWPGPKGFYVDDKAVRPKEFLTMSEDELRARMEDDKCP